MGTHSTFNVTLKKNKDIIDKSINYCEENHLLKVQLVEIALQQFFNNRKNQLMTLSKEQLVDLVTSYESKEDNNYGSK